MSSGSVAAAKNRTKFDLYGYRDGHADHVVGIQCKLKSEGHALSEKEVRHEISEALHFRPALREYFITTTAPDDADLQQIAAELALEQKAKGRSIQIYVWGWNTLQERISEHAAARKAFDPTYGPFSDQLLGDVGRTVLLQEETKATSSNGLSQIHSSLARIEALHFAPGDNARNQNALEAQLDAEIDAYRNLADAGKPRTALPMLEKLLARVSGTASGRILFRVKANIAGCILALGDETQAALLLSDAFDHAPTEPNAIANKALSLLLQRRCEEALSWGRDALAADPSNDGLAGYLVQAARYDLTIEDPQDLVPPALRNSAPVIIGRISALRQRDVGRDWWEAAHAALKVHPANPLVRQFAAEADLDQILRDEPVRRTHKLEAEQRRRLLAATSKLREIWDNAKGGEGVLKPQDVALCCSLIIAYHALDDLPAALDLARQGLAAAPDNADVASRAAMAAIDGMDDDLATEALGRLPDGPDATTLKFRFYAAHSNWEQVLRLLTIAARAHPRPQRSVIKTAGQLAEIKLSQPVDLEKRIETVAENVRTDARSSIVAADFARIEGFSGIADSAYRNAVNLIGPDSHFADRITVAQHAARRSDASVVADLLDGYVEEDHDNEPLRALARAFVNDTPIRRRGVAFFRRLPSQVRELPLYLHAEGLLHFNRGDLKQAEACLRKATKPGTDLTAYLALFATLRRDNRGDEVKPILEGIDLTKVQGEPGQKMYLAQELLASGFADTALSFAYEVLQQSRNDPQAAIRYFGLIMLDPNGRHVPHPTTVSLDTWVRLEGGHGESHSFLVVDADDRPAEERC